MDKIDARTLPVEALNERRRLAVQMRLDKFALEDVARTCGLARTTVIAAHKAYLNAGWQGVDIARQGRPQGSGSRLTPEQERDVRRLMVSSPPDLLQLDGLLWSRGMVTRLIEQSYGLRLAERTLGLYLERWRITSTGLLDVLSPSGSPLLRQWRLARRLDLAARARRENAEVRWGSQTLARSPVRSAETHAQASNATTVRIAYSQSRTSVLACSTNRGELRWLFADKPFDATTLIDFLRRMIGDASRKIILILEPALGESSGVVRHWLSRHSDEIEVVWMHGDATSPIVPFDVHCLDARSPRRCLDARESAASNGTAPASSPAIERL